MQNVLDAEKKLSKKNKKRDNKKTKKMKVDGASLRDLGRIIEKRSKK